MPRLLLWMKKPSDGLCFWIYRFLTIGLVVIAAWARQAKVLKGSSTPRRPWHDVLKLKGGDDQRFCGTAISTAVGKALPNLAL